MFDLRHLHPNDTMLERVSFYYTCKTPMDVSDTLVKIRGTVERDEVAQKC
jgi:hypothetical protein